MWRKIVWRDPDPASKKQRLRRGAQDRLSKAGGELIGFLDADGTYPPSIFRSCARCGIDGADLVIGSRMAGEESKMPVTRGWAISSLLTC